mmetsp:Transcript_69144/g.147971  ORF Transcript_69144/g.147971 Transcript_69144/m.147971 type:complete len:257 (-) Transcript_69144:165-935(-)
MLFGWLRRILALLLFNLLGLLLRIHVVNGLLHNSRLLLLPVLLQPPDVVRHLQILVTLLLRAQDVVSLGYALVELVVLVDERAICDFVRVVLQPQISHLLPQQPEVVLLRKVHLSKSLLDLDIPLLDLPFQDIDTDLVVLAGQVLWQPVAVAFPTGLQDLATLRDLLGQFLCLLVGIGLSFLLGDAEADLALHLPQRLIGLLATAPLLAPLLDPSLVALPLLLRLPVSSLGLLQDGLPGSLQLGVIASLQTTPPGQ